MTMESSGLVGADVSDSACVSSLEKCGSLQALWTKNGAFFHDSLQGNKDLLTSLYNQAASTPLL